MPRFKKYKIRVLEQLGVCLTDHDLAYLEGLNTEIAVDQWGRRVIMERL